MDLHVHHRNVGQNCQNENGISQAHCKIKGGKYSVRSTVEVRCYHETAFICDLYMDRRVETLAAVFRFFHTVQMSVFIHSMMHPKSIH